MSDLYRYSFSYEYTALMLYCLAETLVSDEEYVKRKATALMRTDGGLFKCWSLIISLLAINEINQSAEERTMMTEYLSFLVR